MRLGGAYMKDEFVICEKCGEKCSTDDLYCQNCSQSLSHSHVWSGQIIDGMDPEALKKRIGKNEDYYTEKFAKKKGKWFVQLNFAALLFGPIWFFYRKMYKAGVIYVAITILFAALFTLIVPTSFQKDVEQYHSARKAYENYVNSGKETHIWGEYPYSSQLIGLHPDYQEVSDNLKVAQNKIRLMDFLMHVAPLIVHIVIRLFANSIYKNHIASTIYSGDCGVSVKNAVVSFVVIGIISVIVSVLLGLVPTVSRFWEATDTIMHWM